MRLNIAALRAMMAAGASAEVLLAVVENMVGERRRKDRERQRKARQLRSATISEDMLEIA
jgi:hypothetical protein